MFYPSAQALILFAGLLVYGGTAALCCRQVLRSAVLERSRTRVAVRFDSRTRVTRLRRPVNHQSKSKAKLKSALTLSQIKAKQSKKSKAKHSSETPRPTPPRYTTSFVCHYVALYAPCLSTLLASAAHAPLCNTPRHCRHPSLSNPPLRCSSRLNLTLFHVSL